MKFRFRLTVLRWGHYLRLLAAVAMLATVASAGLAQNAAQYDEMPLYKLNDRQQEITNWNVMATFMREEIKSIEAMLAGGALDQQKFDRFFNDVVFPLFTSRANFTHPTVSPPGMRKRFKTDFVAKASNPAARDRLYDLTLASMDKIANGNFHPVARGNAMLMIAELNDGEPGPPLKKALPVLMRAAVAKDAPDVVRVPAMRGVLRHAAEGIDAEQRPAVTKAMLEIINQRTAPDNRSLEGHEWTVRRAIDVLAALGEPGNGNNGAVFNALVQTIEDESAPRPVRTTAAAAIAQVKYTPPKDFDAQGLAKSLGKLAVEAYKAELAEATSQRHPIVVERLKQQLGEIRQGLEGTDGSGGVKAMSSADAQQKEFVDSLLQAIEELNKACDTEPAEPPDPTIQFQSSQLPPGVPFDTQEPIAKAIAQAGETLEAVLQGRRASDAIPGEVPTDVPPPGPEPGRPPIGRAPNDVPGPLPPG